MSVGPTNDEARVDESLSDKSLEKLSSGVSLIQVVDCVLNGDFFSQNQPCIGIECKGQEFLKSEAHLSEVVFNYEQVSANSLLVLSDDESKLAEPLFDKVVLNSSIGLVLTDSKEIADLAVKRKICTILLNDSCNDGIAPTRRALRAVAKLIRSQANIPVIGITGTSGKTTTKDLTVAALSARCNVLGTLNNQNSVWAVTRTLLRLNSMHDAVVLEFGSRKKGHVNILSEMAQPTIAYVSSIGESHLETFGDFQQVYISETDVYRRVRDSEIDPKLFLVNLDDRHIRKFFRSNKKKLTSIGSVVTLSRNSVRGADVVGRSVQTYGDNKELKTKVYAETPWGNVEYLIPLAGRHNVTNSLAALSLSMLTGKVSLEDVAVAFQGAQISGNRSEIFRMPGGLTILNDSYNANPLSMRAALDTLKRFKEEDESISYVIAAVGDMLELGEGAPNYHYAVGAYARECGVDELWATGEFANHWARGFNRKDSIRIFESTDELLAAILEADNKSFLGEHSCILLKSSHGSGLYKVGAKLKRLKRGGLRA
ncbi:MAG: UDP-N-acetylmuramoyl-tripeptide--D-alanyl-D-alanine ligase [SAR324 cluster bacterium]|uniref:UDP-N-acetylmuramoyl-tripeptide--D-alanyl-D-alanine ligase n=1 Tax=SAR324 cluster bacterium TaxID=2024889 RepID=A0A7X9FP35_9DELT|nr:UDP-N-acetylmuramoyl-tripeptide--D-alanyl-D-alanine ligase [SAR324 cluster bacterium]